MGKHTISISVHSSQPLLQITIFFHKLHKATYHQHHHVAPPSVVVEDDDDDARCYQLFAWRAYSRAYCRILSATFADPLSCGRHRSRSRPRHATALLLRCPPLPRCHRVAAAPATAAAAKQPPPPLRCHRAFRPAAANADAALTPSCPRRRQAGCRGHADAAAVATALPPRFCHRRRAATDILPRRCRCR